MGPSGASSSISLEPFDWPSDESDKDANFKQEVAMYSREDPMPTIETMSRNLRIPIGAIVRYVLVRSRPVKWCKSASSC